MDTSHLAEHAGAAGSLFASIFVVATYTMRTMIPLRVFGMLTNIILIITAIPSHNYATLILHSDNDFRVPIEQGEQWYRALKHFGVTTEIVLFPRENHNLTRTGEPKHLIESLNWQLYWFDRFINGNSNAVPPDQK